MMTRTEELWTRFLSDGPLTPAEEQELLDAMEADPALRERLLHDKQFDGLLGAVCADDADAFAKSFQDRLAVEGDSKFIKRVEERIRRPSRPTTGRSEFSLGLIAAGVLAAIALIVMFSSSKSPAPVVKIPVREIVPAPPPPPPPPPKVEVPVVPPPQAPEKPRVEPLVVPPPPLEVPKPAPKPEEPKAPEPLPELKPKPEPKVTTVVIVARVDRDGEISALPAGGGVEGPATVLYADGTKLTLGAQTSIQNLLDAKGKSLTMTTGVLTADVVKQPAPMILKTPHAEIRVLGTTLRVTVDPTSTRLDVLSGKVRLVKLLDGKAVDVVTGHYAIAGAGVEFAARPLAPKPKAVMLQENFQGGLDARWKTVGTASLLKTAGQLDIDLTTKPPSPDGWSGAGILSKQTFAPSMAVCLDVDLPVLHSSVVAAVVFIPQGQKRGGDGVFRFQLRGSRYSLATESGEAKDIAGADRTGAAGRERWRIEVDGAAVRLLVNDVEILKHKHGLAVAPGYAIEIDGSVRTDAPSGARAGFDSLVIEALK